MTTQIGKKYVLLSPEVYESLIQQSTNQNSVSILNPPEKNAMNNAESNLKNVWDRKDLPEDEKVKYFTKELNSLKRYRDSMLSPKQTSTKNKDEAEKHKDNYDPPSSSPPVISNEIKIEEIVSVLPKSIRKEASQILMFIKSNPDKLSWNRDKELIYAGSILHGSNIADLLVDTLSNRKKTISPTMFRNTFSKGLAEIGLPKEWIKNNDMKIKVDIQGKENQSMVLKAKNRTKSTPTPLKLNRNVNKKTPSKWLSSTSSVR